MCSYFFYDLFPNTRPARKDWARPEYFRRVFLLQSHYPFGQNIRSRSEWDQRFENFLLHTTSLAETHFFIVPAGCFRGMLIQASSPVEKCMRQNPSDSLRKISKMGWECVHFTHSLLCAISYI